MSNERNDDPDKGFGDVEDDDAFDADDEREDDDE